MLSRVLREIEAASGPLNLNELSRKLGVERGALEGMITYLFQQGRLKVDESQGAAQAGCSCSGCGTSCSGQHACPSTMKMPRTFSVRR